jgi:hypothetical protein
MSDPTAGDPADPLHRHDSAAIPNPSGDQAPPPPPPPPLRPPFPWVRLLYAIAFSVLAWVFFWAIVAVLAPLHYIVIAVAGHPNAEIEQMNRRAVHYLFQMLAFISGASDEKPFPLGPFPAE